MNDVFTKTDFLDVFVRYNTAVGVAPWVLVGLGLLALAAVMGEWRGRDAWVSGVLGALWIWSGIAFHWAFFADVNPLAGLFGALFVGQGAAFVHFGIFGNELSFAKPRQDARGFAGGMVIGYAVFLYPLASLAAGHMWPAMPTFGAPCPVTLFTLGLLLWSKGPVPKLVLIVPVSWAMLAIVAAVDFDMYEDLGLLVAATAALRLLWRRGGADEFDGHETRRGSAIPHRIWRHALKK